MKVRSFLHCEAANLICWFRIVVSVILAMMKGGGIFVAMVFSAAFISDAWDGWFYRRLRVEERPGHWFNRLPISMDPLADFIFVAGGYIHVAERKRHGILCFALIALILFAWQIVARRGSDKLYAVMMTMLTYYWFAVMMSAMVAVWRRNVAMPAWIVGVAATLVLFYASYFKTRVKERTIRRRG